MMTLQSVVEDDLFPAVDLSLRAGRHIDERDDFVQYAFLRDSQELLEHFYHRFGWDLIHSVEGFFYLRPVHARVRRRRLSLPEMLLGQALAYLLLDPATVEQKGIVPRSQAYEILVNLVGEERLKQALFPHRRRHDQRVEDEKVRQEFDRALRTLQGLGFVTLVNDSVYLRLPLMRFAEAVKGLDRPQDALARLVARGDAEPLEESDEEEETEA